MSAHTNCLHARVNGISRLVVREDLSKHDQVSIFETVRERLDAAEAAIGRLAPVVHQQHVILSQGVASWPVA